ncbi:unnamed protein product [Rhizopus stolonifer]
MKDRAKISTKNDEQKKNSQLLPPSNPPPPTPQTKDTTFLLSPWWSEEATAPPTESRETEKKSHHRHRTILLGLQRYMEHKEDKEINWKEKCYLLANVPKMEYKEKSDRENLEKLFDHSNECSMVCFLKESEKLVKRRLLEEEGSAECEYNPLHGAWISVAKTPKRCRDHILGDQTIITKKNYPDYYTINLAREINPSSEHGEKKKCIKRALCLCFYSDKYDHKDMRSIATTITTIH